MGEDAQAVEEADPQHRREHGPGEPEDEQQRPEVADEQVLDHVGPEELVGQRAQRGEGDDDQAQAAQEARAPPARDRARRAGQVVGAQGVEDPGDGGGSQLEGDLHDVRLTRRDHRDAGQRRRDARPAARGRMRSPSTARARISVITGYSEPTTETMLSAPFVLATA